MDFLSFKSFISIPVLIGFYYIGAVIMPVFLWLVSIWLTKKFQWVNTLQKKAKETLWQLLNTRQKIIFILMFIIAFVFMQLFWRMLFEFLIAYLQIRVALLI